MNIDDIVSCHGTSVAAFEAKLQLVVGDSIAASGVLGGVRGMPASRSGTRLNNWAEKALVLAACRVRGRGQAGA